VTIIIIERAHAIAARLESLYADKETRLQTAWWILEALLQKSKALLLTIDSLTLTPEQEATLEQWLTQLVDHHMPLPYLIGHVPFCALTIDVEAPILIPRPETEEWVINLITALTPTPPSSILDLCTGTGCIALAMAHAFPAATVTGIDKDPRAIALARRNASLNHSKNVTFEQSDLYSALQGHRYDLILSNPPYISHRVWENLDASVKNWEAYTALVAPNDGLALIETIIRQAPYYIQPHTRLPKNLYIEIGYDQGPIVAQMMEHASMTNIQIHKDLAGKDRVVSGRVDYVETSSSLS
jgi:release factor glutamine methyltransferase